MPHAITPELLENIDSFEALAEKLFHDELGWPVPAWMTFSGVPRLYELDSEDIPGVVNLSAVQKFEADQEWGIFLVDFSDNQLKRGELRRILNKVAERARQTHGNPVWPHEKILFICKHKEGWTFAYFTGDKLANAKLRGFGWENPQEARTAIENLQKLEWGRDWSEAWNVEKLTKEFFAKLSELFYDAMEAVKRVIPDENARRLFIQTLFNRLIFLRFVEKKGWLELNGRSDYLRALWQAGQDDPNPFWPTRLNALFNSVNYPTSDNIHRISRPLIGDVPYLNGGLFDEDHRFADPNVSIPAEIFDALLGDDGLFYRYNFTVEESSPLDVQVAVDPEVLGKIFEQLTIATKRHDTGSYYTPREIVQFMCREALVGYLRSKGIAEEKARAVVYDHDKTTLSDSEGDVIWEAILAVKVVDPACGSGAYLLGMLQELFAILNLFDRRDKRTGEDPAKLEHDRKLWIIENNLYGVDLQAFATNTAMLRLWLTLLVEDTGATPQPLPNLEYKIEVGDSLLGPDPSQPIDWSRVQRGLDFEGVHETVDALRKLREQYQNSHGAAKNQIKADLEAKLAELREKVTGSPTKDPAKFDWRVEFFDVFLGKGSSGVPPDSGTHRRDGETTLSGFDVVLANPPYVRQELIKDQKPALKARFGDLFSGTADLYTFFYFRGVQLLKSGSGVPPDGADRNRRDGGTTLETTLGGMFAFISSNKWFRAAYGEKLRAFMAENTAIRSITDFGELPVFSAATFPMIFVAQKKVVARVVSASRRSEPPHRPEAETTFQSGSCVPPDGENRPEAETTFIQRQGYFLPHWTTDGAIYHLVFRLRDSLPREVLERFEAEKLQIERQAAGRTLSKQDARRLKYLVSDSVERYLDAGHGECMMKDPRIADLVQAALTHFDGQRYHLHAWAVMPNHVHAVVQPLEGFALDNITHSWKSFSAHEINKLLGREGEVWMKESYDHIIRNEEAYHAVVQYVLDNPAKGKLSNWKWVGSKSGSGKGGSGVPPDKDQRDAETTFQTLFTQVKSLDPPYPDVKALIEQGGFELPPDAIRGSEWTLADKDTLARLRRMEASGIPLGEYVKGKIYRGILTGFNEAFVIDGAKRAELIAEDPKSAEIIKPLAVGDDVRRWRIRDSGKWLIYVPWHFPLHLDKSITGPSAEAERLFRRDYPAIFRHLLRFKEQLSGRNQAETGIRYEWWALQRWGAEYFAEFDKPKIVYPQIMMERRFTLDRALTYTNQKCFIICVDDPFLLGLLNSRPVWWFLATQVVAFGDTDNGGRIEPRKEDIESIPLPRASDADRDAIAALVQKCLDAANVVSASTPNSSDQRDAETTLRELEAEIDARVEFLYFHQDEATSYDEWLAKKEAEKGTIVEEVRKLIEGGENSRVEFKETLEAGGTTPEHRAAVFTASLRAICSFINKDGGTLLFGVHDTNGIVGLERDGATDAPGRDRFLQKIASALKNRAVNYSPNLVDVQFAEVDGDWVAKVDVKPTRGPKVLLDGKLYVRDLTTTVELDPTTMAYMANVEVDVT